MYPGVGHGDDLSYIFPMTPPFFPPSVVTPSQQKTRQILLDLLESFAMSGRPSTAEGSQAWTPLDPSRGEYFEVKLSCTEYSVEYILGGMKKVLKSCFRRLVRRQG